MSCIQEGDRIVEVNGINVMEDTHHEVVSKIKAKPNTVGLLVIDKQGEQYYKDKGMVIHGEMSNIIQCETSLQNVSGEVESMEVQPAVVAAVHSQQGKVLELIIDEFSFTEIEGLTPKFPKLKVRSFSFLESAVHKSTYLIFFKRTILCDLAKRDSH